MAPGDPVPAAVLAGARHWARDGAAGGRVLVVNLSSTRCPESEVCGAVERNLRLLQDELQRAPALKDSVGLLTLSVDPAFDVPRVLRAHADRIGANAEVWRFGALPLTEVPALRAALGPSTAIVDAGGRIVKLYSGSDWKVKEIARDLESLVLRTDPVVRSAYLRAQEALAADDVQGAKRTLAELSKAIGAPEVSRLADDAAAAPDLASIRAAFKPLSEALVRLRWPPEYLAMYCPMFDGNRGATWVQKAGPVRNPYFGNAMLHCGNDLSTGAHADHSPRHGGGLFMAADGYHHVEGTYSSDGVFRIFVNDNFRRPMAASRFRARVVLKEERDSKTQDLRELVVIPVKQSADGMTLYAGVGVIALPAEITLKMTLDPRGPEERFDFVFAEYTRRD